MFVWIIIYCDWVWSSDASIRNITIFWRSYWTTETLWNYFERAIFKRQFVPFFFISLNFVFVVEMMMNYVQVIVPMKSIEKHFSVWEKERNTKRTFELRRSKKCWKGLNSIKRRNLFDSKLKWFPCNQSSDSQKLHDLFVGANFNFKLKVRSIHYSTLCSSFSAKRNILLLSAASILILLDVAKERLHIKINSA